MGLLSIRLSKGIDVEAFIGHRQRLQGKHKNRLTERQMVSNLLMDISDGTPPETDQETSNLPRTTRSSAMPPPDPSHVAIKNVAGECACG